MTTLSAPLVGMKYHPGAAEKLSELGFGDSLTLIREPENPHDENAIMVHSSGILLGYIAREYAADWAPSLDAGSITDAKLAFASTGHPRVEVEMRDYEEEFDEDAVQSSEGREVQEP